MYEESSPPKNTNFHLKSRNSHRCEWQKKTSLTRNLKSADAVSSSGWESFMYFLSSPNNSGHISFPAVYQREGSFIHRRVERFYSIFHLNIEKGELLREKLPNNFIFVWKNIFFFSIMMFPCGGFIFILLFLCRNFMSIKYQPSSQHLDVSGAFYHKRKFFENTITRRNGIPFFFSVNCARIYTKRKYTCLFVCHKNSSQTVKRSDVTFTCHFFCYLFK